MTTRRCTLPTRPDAPDSAREKGFWWTCSGRVLRRIGSHFSGVRIIPGVDRLSRANDTTIRASPAISRPMNRYVNEERKRLAIAPPKSTIRPTAPTATLILRLCMAASSAARRRCDGVGGGDSNAPHSTSGYLMAAPEVRALHKRFVRRAGWSAGHGRKTRFRVDARRPRRSRRPARTRREHQESDESRRAVRAASRAEPRDDLREVVDADSRVVRGRNDPARRARPLPQPE